MTTYKSVKSPLLNVFKDPNPESGRVIQLKRGAVVEVLDEQIAGKKGVNTYVRFTDHQDKTAEGYVAGLHLEAREDQALPAAIPPALEALASLTKQQEQKVPKPAKQASPSRKDAETSE
jgi:hypothetical protein